MAEPVLPQKPETTQRLQNDPEKRDMSRIVLPSRTPPIPPRRPPSLSTVSAAPQAQTPVIPSRRPARVAIAPAAPAPLRPRAQRNRSAPASRCTDVISSFRLRFDPARPKRRRLASPLSPGRRRHPSCRPRQGSPPHPMPSMRSIPFRDGSAGIARPCPLLFFSSKLELRVSLSSWKRPLPLRL